MLFLSPQYTFLIFNYLYFAYFCYFFFLFLSTIVLCRFHIFELFVVLYDHLFQTSLSLFIYYTLPIMLLSCSYKHTLNSYKRILRSLKKQQFSWRRLRQSERVFPHEQRVPKCFAPSEARPGISPVTYG